MKMKLRVAIAVGAVLLVAAVIAYLAVESPPSDSQEVTTQTYDPSLSLGLEDEELVSIEILRTSGETLRFHRKDGAWAEASNPDVILNSSSVEDIYVNLRHLQADKSLDTQTPIEPDITLIARTLDSEGNEKEITIRFGIEGDAVNYEAESKKFQAPAERIAFLEKSLDDFRHRSYPFVFDHFQADNMVIHRESDKYKFEVSLTDSGWMEQPENPHRRPDSAKIGELLNELRGLTVTKFLKNGEAPAPKENQIFIFNKVRQPLYGIVFGGDLKIDGIKHYVVRTSLTGNALFAVPAEQLDSIKNKELFTSVSN